MSWPALASDASSLEALARPDDGTSVKQVRHGSWIEGKETKGKERRTRALAAWI